MNNPLFSKDIPVYFKAALGIISAITIVLAIFCVSGEWQWWQILVSVAFLFILVILATYLVRHFYKNDSGDKQNLEIFKELQQSLEEFNITSPKTPTMLIKEVFEKITDTIEEPKKSEIRRIIDSLAKKLSDVNRDARIWESAKEWLKINYPFLVEVAIKQLLTKMKELEAPGGCFHSIEQRKRFEESIDEHIQCILKALQPFSHDEFEELEHKQLVCEKLAYKIVFDIIYDEIVKRSKSSLDSDAVDLLLKIFRKLKETLA